MRALATGVQWTSSALCLHAFSEAYTTGVTQLCTLFTVALAQGGWRVLSGALARRVVSEPVHLGVQTPAAAGKGQPPHAAPAPPASPSSPEDFEDMVQEVR